MTDAPPTKRRLTYLVRQNLRFRQFGMPFMGAVLGISIYPLKDPVLWTLLGLHVLLWPLIALQLAKRSDNPDQQEYRNLYIEAGIYGLWLPALAFSPLPCLLLAITSLVNIANVRGLKPVGMGLVCMGIGTGLMGLYMGLTPEPRSSTLADIIAVSVIVAYVSITASVSQKLRFKIASTRAKLAESQSQYEALATKLARYLSPQVYDSIFKGKTTVQLQTYRKKLTVFFSDIKGFTELTDTMEAEALTALLNSYLDEMSSIALRHGGTIDKFIGDAIMVFFGDPETRGEKEDALACVQMAIEMREAIKKLRRQWRDQGVAKPLHIRVGINSGHCTVGNFGSDARMDYTIIGGQVNLASRLESAAGVDQILISEDTYTLIRDLVACTKKDQIQVKGISHPVQTFEVRNLYSALDEEGRTIEEQSKGFALSLDLDQVDDSNEVRATLQAAIERLEMEQD
jgi:class 3 adenylate cyclase